MKKQILGLFSLLLAVNILSANAWGLSVVRGPYLQSETPSSIIVRWRTDSNSNSEVRYGASPGNLTQTVNDFNTGTEHIVELTGLSSDTTYYYSVGSDSQVIAGDDTDHRFTTAPVAGTAKDTRIWVLGDSGTANSNAAAVRNAYYGYPGSDSTELIMMLGDNAYNSGTDSEYQNAVFNFYPSILRNTVLWSTLGNHDGQSADSTTQSGTYYDIFSFTKNGEAGGTPSGTEAYYSFDYGNIHFVCLDSYDTNRSPSGTMLTWLQNDLSSTTQDWIIAFWHHPPYSKGSHNSDSESRLIDMRQNALPILEDYGVDLVLGGHSHAYERSVLLDSHYGNSGSLTGSMILDSGDGRETGNGAYNKLPTPHNGAVYVVAGSSGQATGGSLNHPAMYISLNNLGSMVLDVNGNRLDAHFLRENGSTPDHFTILKGPDTYPPELLTATAPTASTVELEFNEALDQTIAETVSNYNINGGVSVISATLLGDNHSVELTTSTLTQGATYTVTANNIEDLNNNAVSPAEQAQFQWLNQVNESFQNGVSPTTGYSGTRDTYLNEGSSNSNFGNSTALSVDGDDGGGDDLKPLIEWDVSSIPLGSTVQSAELTFNIFDVSGNAYQIYEAKTGWTENQASWNEAANGIPWQIAGANGSNDVGNQVLGTVSAGSTGSLTVALNTNGIAMVQNWVNNPGQNHGIIVTNNSASNGADWDSSEVSTATNRPKLSINYSLGVPDTSPPTTPTNLQVTGTTASSVSLGWNAATDNIGVTGYRVYRDNNLEATTSNTSITNSGLTANTSYNYQVSAIDAAGNESALTAIVIGTTDSLPPPSQAINPSPADGVTNVDVNNNLSWTSGVDTDSHNVYFGTTSGSLVFQGNQTGNSFSPGTLLETTTYYWRIDEVNGIGTTTGAEWSFTTEDPLPADVITVLEARYKADRDEFKIKAISSEQPDAVLTVIGYGQMTFKRDKYELKMRPFNQTVPQTVTISSSFGGEITVPIDGAPPLPVPGDPSSPSPVDDAVDVATSAGLSWDAGVNTDSHEVYFGTNPGSLVFQGSQTDTSFNPSALANNTSYYWRIDEVNRVGTTMGPVWSFTTVATPAPPGLPNNPTPADGATAVSITSSVNWNAGSQAASHNVYFGTSATPPLVSSGQAGTSYNPGTLNYLTTYYWQIEEINGLGNTLGPVWRFTTHDSNPADVIDITKAEWNRKKNELKVEATSSGSPDAVLTVVGFGVMNYDSRKDKYKFRLKPVNSNPGTVTVSSDLDGSDTLTVRQR